jgi:hypothetical protein
MCWITSGKHLEYFFENVMFPQHFPHQIALVVGQMLWKHHIFKEIFQMFSTGYPTHFP